MKKILMIMISLCLCFSFTACTAKQEWTKEDAKKIGNDLSSGQFVIDGDIFTFPMDLQDILDMGWHVSNNYSNVKTFTLEPGEGTETFSLFPDDDKESCISVAVINMTNETATVDKCMVTKLHVENSEFDFLLPGEVSKRSTQKDVEDAYGEPQKEVEEDYSKTYYYTYTTEEGYNCIVEMEVYNKKNATYPLMEVTYSLVYSNVYDVENECRLFIDSALKTSYYNDNKDYVANLYDTKEGAEKLYQSEVEYYASCIMLYADINEKYMTDDILNQFYDIAKIVLSKVKWEIKNMDVAEDEYEGTVELALYPTNYMELIDGKLDDALYAFNDKYGTADFGSMSKEELVTIENDYASLVLAEIKGLENEVKTKEPIVKTYEIGDNVLTGEQWNEIDDIIMDVESEE